MKTLEQIISQYKSKTLDNRDISRLIPFIKEKDLPLLNVILKEEYVGKHIPIEFNRENVLIQLAKDVEFGFEKALDQRGISASLMYDVVSMWNWVLEEGLEDFTDYAQYGLPLFKATAVKYNFDNPIGDNIGNESYYACE